MFGRIESGDQDFSKRRGESNGLMFMRFNAWLDSLCKINPVGNINLVAFERAHHRGGYATEIGVGLTTRVQEFACRIGAEYMAIHTGTLKKFVTGSGKASKEDMMAWFKKQTGRAPISDDEADALGLLFVACNEVGVDIDMKEIAIGDIR